jgi:hypothetical protein
MLATNPARSQTLRLFEMEECPSSKRGPNVFKNYWGLRLLPGAQSTGSKCCRPGS